MTLIYTGIGSRQTPQDILSTMYNIGYRLNDAWLLRSGYADGADKAFLNGACDSLGCFEMYVPWVGYNDAPKTDPRFIVPKMTFDQFVKAAQFHPNWGACSFGAKKIHVRNVCQILGEDLNTPSDMVICWTPNGSGRGGTGQALRIAEHYNIPIFDLAIEANEQKLIDFVNQKEHEHG